MSRRNQQNSSDESDEEISADEAKDSRIQTLSDFTDSSFLYTVRDAFNFLTEDDAPAYFKVVLEHFNDTSLKTEYGKEILISIRRLIRRKEIFQVFKNKKVIHHLPFAYAAYNDQIYAIVYDVLNLEPSILDEKFCDHNRFANSVKEDPKKALSIIGKLAQKVDISESDSLPLPLLEILIKQSGCFITPDLVETYIAILYFLCKESESFANAHINDIWGILVKYTSRTVIECNKYIYLGLCNLLDVYTEAELDLIIPFEALNNDLTKEITQETALKFIFCFASSDKSNAVKLNNSDLLTTLLSIASENVKEASIVLTYLADTDENLASTIFQCQNGSWILKLLPQAEDTLKLFLTIFKYDDLRNEITKNKHFVSFLNFCLKHMSSPGIITIVTTIIRRIKLNNDIVSKLVKKDFIKLYIKTVLDNDDKAKVSSHSLLLMINTLAKYSCADQFLEVIPIVKKLLNDENLSEIASFAAADLSSNMSCLNKMVDLGIDSFFKKHLKDQDSKHLRHNSRKFLRNKKKMYE